jgi:hypothetical protein
MRAPGNLQVHKHPDQNGKPQVFNNISAINNGIIGEGNPTRMRAQFVVIQEVQLPRRTWGRSDFSVQIAKSCPDYRLSWLLFLITICGTPW